MPWNQSGRFRTTASQKAIDLAKSRCSDWLESLGYDPSEPRLSMEWTAFLDMAVKSLQKSKATASAEKI